jgi:hypothetical protein
VLAVALAAEARAPRGAAALRRDQARVAKLPPLTALAEGPLAASPMTRTLAASGWLQWGEGARRIDVELGGGVRLVGDAHRYQFPWGHTTKLETLRVEVGGRSLDLTPEVPVLLHEASTHFWKGRVTWQGPISKLALLSLFHELGHAADYAAMSTEERVAFEALYERKDHGLPLDEEQRRQLIAHERRGWAHALVRLRALRREGFDLLPGVSDREIHESIDRCLKSYLEYRGA